MVSITLPTPGDPATTGSWGTTVNTAINAILTAVNAQYPANIVASGTYLPDKHIYFPPGARLTRTPAKFAQAATGTGGGLKIAYIGPSTTSGWNGTASLRGTGQSSPEVLRNLISNFGYSVGEGSVRLNDFTAQDSRLSFTGTWAASGAVAAAYVYFYSSAIGSTVTMTSSRAGTNAEIEIASTSGSCTVSIDGALYTGAATATRGTWTAGTSVFAATGTNNSAKLVISGLTNTTHTIKLTQNTSTVFLPFGMDLYPTNSVRIANFGSSGTTSGHWSNSSVFYTLINEVFWWAPDLVIMDLGMLINDWNASTSNLATVQTNLQAITTYIRTMTGTPEIILVSPGPFISPSNGAPTTAFWQNMFTLADAQSIPLIYNFERWGGTWAAANANLLMGSADTVHPNATGYHDIAQSIMNALNIYKVA